MYINAIYTVKHSIKNISLCTMSEHTLERSHINVIHVIIHSDGSINCTLTRESMQERRSHINVIHVIIHSDISINWTVTGEHIVECSHIIMWYILTIYSHKYHTWPGITLYIHWNRQILFYLVVINWILIWIRFMVICYIYLGLANHISGIVEIRISSQD